MTEKLRIPAVPSLSAKLPKGAEGGKEFARILDLLLFHEAKARGEVHQVVNDAAGDFAGLDGYKSAHRVLKAIGYQYKFYPGPLSDSHRSDIEKSLQQAIAQHKKSKIRKWILVTPDDLTESSRRKSGGDISWFNGLREKYKAPFEVEHYGHTKIVYYFLKCSDICVWYYPELVSSGAEKRTNLERTRASYNLNLLQRYGKVEFVGMSVLKEEAGKGVPLEHIYVPLSAISEDADDRSEDIPQVAPLTAIAPGRNTVVLGDPGSGKSTMLAFLALVGISPALRERAKAKSDDRLALIVTLRRYADELKRRTNLTILEYIVESCRADYSLDDFNREFLESYLNSGRAILLFDGLDELPNPSYKKLVRDRISSISNNYPGNAIIVTSRIVGYDAEIRFPDAFAHLKLARLRQAEIEAFINDWYKVRIENEADRSANAGDLIRIVRQAENVAIRELAGNPLLLTIIALVHRIDAVLPDERVVLYQKCVETLLNTWHKWKFRSDEEYSKTRIEKRNRRRVEAIAYWMQCRSTSDQGRAVVPEEELRKFLVEHVSATERGHDPNEHIEDIADEFINFIKKRTGLLIEVGDRQYSFVHLTFQEYLAATWLVTDGETGGVSDMWHKVSDRANDPRWTEVLRLMVASLRSDEAQRYFVEKLIEENAETESPVSYQLLGGLLADGIEPAEERAEEIVQRLIAGVTRAEHAEDVSLIVRSMRLWCDKESANQALASGMFRIGVEDQRGPQRITYALAGVLLGLESLKGVWNAGPPSTAPFEAQLYEALVHGHPMSAAAKRRIEPVWELYHLYALTSPGLNIASAVGQALQIRIVGQDAFSELFRRQLIVLGAGNLGPFEHFFDNTLRILDASAEELPPEVAMVLRSHMRRPSRLLKADQLSQALSSYADHDFQRRGLEEKLARTLPETQRDLLSPDEEYARPRSNNAQGRLAWKAWRADPKLLELATEPLLRVGTAWPEPQWHQLLNIKVPDILPDTLGKALGVESRERLLRKWQSRSLNSNEKYYAAWLLMVDAFCLLVAEDGRSLGPIVDKHRELARSSDCASLTIASSIYDAALDIQSGQQRLADLIGTGSTGVTKELRRALWLSRRPGHRASDSASHRQQVA